VTKPGFILWGLFYVVVYFYGCMFAFAVCFSFSVLSQDIGWEERLRNYMFCVEWDIKR